MPARETSYARRGFRGATQAMQSRLEQVGAAFLRGYHASLQCAEAGGLAQVLQAEEAELRGFAFEGAAMGLALCDGLTPWRTRRVAEFLRGPAQAHAYMVHVGVGWAWLRWRRSARRTRSQLEPLLGWLAFDGCGFHEGFFHWRNYLLDGPPPGWVTGYAARAFDQGLGRSWWFVNGGNPELLQQTIAGFSPSRRADMWSGTGLAATYAGLAEPSGLRRLRRHAGPFWPCLAQGAAFAAKARQRADNLTDYTELACRTLCDLPALEAARLCDETLENLPADGPDSSRPSQAKAEPAYELWRQRVQGHFALARSEGRQTALPT